MSRPGLAPGQLGHVRVLLLRHDRGAGRVGVVDLHPAELGRGPEHDLLAEPGQVHAEQRRREAELGREVTVAHRVHRVLRGAVEAQLGGDRLRVQRQRRAGQRARAERADRGPLVPVPQPADVPGQRLAVREQLVAEHHRLRVLQVGHARRRGVQVLLGLGEQRGLQLGHPGHHPPGVVAQVQPQVGGDLVVAAAAGPQLAAERADPLQQAALQRGVHVLVGHRGPEAAVLAGRVQAVQRGRAAGPARRRRAARPGAAPGRAPGRRAGRSGPAASRTGRSPTAGPAPRPGWTRTGRPTAGSACVPLLPPRPLFLVRLRCPGTGNAVPPPAAPHR